MLLHRLITALVLLPLLLGLVWFAPTVWVYAVFVVVGDTARLKLVGIGLTDENSVEIRTGIRSGEQVVVSGHNLLNEGDTVLIKSEPTAEN